MVTLSSLALEAVKIAPPIDHALPEKVDLLIVVITLEVYIAPPCPVVVFPIKVELVIVIMDPTELL